MTRYNPELFPADGAKPFNAREGEHSIPVKYDSGLSAESEYADLIQTTRQKIEEGQK